MSDPVTKVAEDARTSFTNLPASPYVALRSRVQCILFRGPYERGLPALIQQVADVRGSVLRGADDNVFY